MVADDRHVEPAPTPPQATDDFGRCGIGQINHLELSPVVGENDFISIEIPRVQQTWKMIH